MRVLSGCIVEEIMVGDRLQCLVGKMEEEEEFEEMQSEEKLTVHKKWS